MVTEFMMALLKSFLKACSGRLAVAGAAEKERIHIPRQLCDSDEGNDYDAYMNRLVQALHGGLHLGIDSIAQDDQVSGVDQEIQHHEVHGAEEQTKRELPLFPSRPQQGNAVA